MSGPRSGGGGPDRGGPATLAPGGRLGPYRIGERLGGGGFGETFRARHEALGLDACLKAARADAPEALFLREARILWGLHHEALPTLRDVLRTREGRIVLAMRLCPGAPLGDGPPPTTRQTLRLLRTALTALGSLHARGIVHGDVKPPNLLVTDDREQIALVDFGCAAVRPTAATRPVGHTAVFAPPEVIAGGPPIPESDLFGLGMSFLHALGGDVAKRVLPEGLPEPLLRLLISFTQKDPGKRPSWASRRDPLRHLEHVVKALR